MRGFLGQDVTLGQSTVTGRGPAFLLPQRPVNAVTAVVLKSNSTPIVYDLNGAVLDVATAERVLVTYSHGYTDADMPDELIELVCQIAVRLDGAKTAAGVAMAQGVQQQAAGPFNQTFGWDAWKATSGLTQGEKDTLTRIWPDQPQIINMGSPVDLDAPRWDPPRW